MKRLIHSALMVGALFLAAPEAPAQNNLDGDSPDHGVARVSLLVGDVTVRRGDSGEDVDAELNAPLVERDHLFTGRNARAEVQLDWANLLRLAPDSEVRFTELADRRFRVELSAGLMTVRVLRDSDGRLEINTPTANIRPKDKGTYRIVVRDDYSTEVSVRSGDVDVFIGRDSSRLRSGDALLISGDPSNPSPTRVRVAARDDWDLWNETRDRDLERSDSYKYVSRHIYGADDLYSYGRWVYDSPYGWVWAPTVGFEWAPYRNGRWINTAYYGWTWVSSDPWGWAPYHYGRWYQASRYGWVWYPGAINVRHYWKPALVGFFGWGDGDVRIGFGFGNVGWVPLAPYEVYRPWYGRPNVTIVNVIQRTNVINGYRNARVVSGRDGFTGLRAGDFGRRRTSPNDFVRIDGRDTRVLDSRPRAVTPPREAPRAGDRGPQTPRNGRIDDAQPQGQGRGQGQGQVQNQGPGQGQARGRGDGQAQGQRPGQGQGQGRGNDQNGNIAGREAPGPRSVPQQIDRPDGRREAVGRMDATEPATAPGPVARQDRNSQPEIRIGGRPDIAVREIPDRGGPNPGNDARTEAPATRQDRNGQSEIRIVGRPQVAERQIPDRGRADVRVEPRAETRIEPRQDRGEVRIGVGRSPSVGVADGRRSAAEAARPADNARQARPEAARPQGGGDNGNRGRGRR